jgi:hypothetical protein
MEDDVSSALLASFPASLICLSWYSSKSPLGRSIIVLVDGSHSDSTLLSARLLSELLLALLRRCGDADGVSTTHGLFRSSLCWTSASFRILNVILSNEYVQRIESWLWIEYSMSGWLAILLLALKSYVVGRNEENVRWFCGQLGNSESWNASLDMIGGCHKTVANTPTIEQRTGT